MSEVATLKKKVKNLEEIVDRLDKMVEYNAESIIKILKNEDKIIAILEKLSDPETYHDWLKTLEAKGGGEPSPASQLKNSPK